MKSSKKNLCFLKHFSVRLCFFAVYFSSLLLSLPGCNRKSQSTSPPSAAPDTSTPQNSPEESVREAWKTTNDDPVFSKAAEEAFLGKILERADEFWRGDHWTDHRNYKNWIGHSSTCIFYVLARAEMTGDPLQLDRVGQHYRWIRERFWNPEIRAWVDDHDVMANACMALNVSAGLCRGGRFLDPETRLAMEADLKDVCHWLEHRNTSALKDTEDLRACNQDAIAAGALALSSAYFGDTDFRRMALEKLRLIFKRSEGPFWIEGGVDKAYMIAGESSFALAADLLWDDLTEEEKRRVAEITMRPYAAGAMGLEKTRSESSLGKEEEGSTATAILGRISNPLIIADTRRAYATKQGARNPWWIFDTPVVAYYWGIFSNSDLLAKGADGPFDIGWGGQAKLEMKIAEMPKQGGSADQKTFLTSESGMTALFGDTSGWGDHYALHNRKAEKRPDQYNQGGLRYVAKGRTVSVWADGKFDFPRPVFGNAVESNGSLHLDSCGILPGFVGSQYRLEQSLTDSAGKIVGALSQNFVVLGDFLIGRLQPDDHARHLPDLRFVLTVPAQGISLNPSRSLATWEQGSLYSGDAKSKQAILTFGKSKLSLVTEALKPYLANEPIRNWVFDGNVSFVNAKPEFDLSRVVIPIVSDEATGWFALATGSGREVVAKLAETSALAQNIDAEVLTFSDGKREYGVVFFDGKAEADKINSVTVSLPSGNFVIDQPARGIFQCVIVEGGRLVGFFIKAAGASWNDSSLIHSTLPETPAQVSQIVTGGICFFDVGEGSVSFPEPDGIRATSLITGKLIDLSPEVKQDRFWFLQP